MYIGKNKSSLMCVKSVVVFKPVVCETIQKTDQLGTHRFSNHRSDNISSRPLDKFLPSQLSLLISYLFISIKEHRPTAATDSPAELRSRQEPNASPGRPADRVNSRQEPPACPGRPADRFNSRQGLPACIERPADRIGGRLSGSPASFDRPADRVTDRQSGSPVFLPSCRSEQLDAPGIIP